MYPIYVLPVSTSPKFHSVSLYDELFFKLQAILRNKLKYTPYVLLVSWFPNFTPFCSMPAVFEI